ncbi:hypothetical protein ABET41_08670 [Metabacillus fastidiosus]|uniref:Sin domain-containing protein n=1 Tax=Metabacillus fastidiosus TaxID=1458 RepID=A0ABU6NZJ7_9BACI|nr:hypothetical protein [Metabacillus fastidiosus]MED4402531.1 hypothetical protein [Metabacillus fastidiosus]MED4461889.1 hypothetical protein [Metabacillus fastidiosus]
MNELDKLKESISNEEWEELVWVTLSTGMTLEEIKEFLHQPSRPE